MQKFNVQSNLRLFGNVRVMVASAMLIAISVTGKYFSIDFGEFLRIGYENLPVVLSGLAFGPIIGAFVGICADLLGCLAKGYAVNPIITIGMASIGAVAGFIPLFFKNRFSPLSIATSDILAHIIGSIIIKTTGIIVYYGASQGIAVLFGSRILNYIPVMIFEIIILIALLSNKQIRYELRRHSK